MPISLFQVSGKRPGQSLVATSVTGQPNNSRLFYILDHTSQFRFLVDTGAEVSLIPPPLHSRSPPTHNTQDFHLLAANGTPIPVYGRQSMTLNFGLRRSFPWIFITAAVKHPILGADFLKHFNLLVDLKHKRLIDSTTHLQAQGSSSSQVAISPVWNITLGDSVYHSILSSFPSIIRLPTFTNTPVSHNVTHHIPTVGQPVHAKPR